MNDENVEIMSSLSLFNAMDLHVSTFFTYKSLYQTQGTINKISQVLVQLGTLLMTENIYEF